MYNHLMTYNHEIDVRGTHLYTDERREKRKVRLGREQERQIRAPILQGCLEAQEPDIRHISYFLAGFSVLFFSQVGSPGNAKEIRCSYRATLHLSKAVEDLIHREFGEKNYSKIIQYSCST